MSSRARQNSSSLVEGPALGRADGRGTSGSRSGEGELALGVSGLWVQHSTASPCPWLCQPRGRELTSLHSCTLGAVVGTWALCSLLPVGHGADPRPSFPPELAESHQLWGPGVGSAEPGPVLFPPCAVLRSGPHFRGCRRKEMSPELPRGYCSSCSGEGFSALNG